MFHNPFDSGPFEMHDGDVLTPASRNTIRRFGGGGGRKLNGVNQAEVKMPTDVKCVWKSRRTIGWNSPPEEDRRSGSQSGGAAAPQKKDKKDTVMQKWQHDVGNTARR